MTDTYTLGSDAWGTVEDFIHFDGDRAVVGFRGDNTARMDENARLRNDGSNGYSPSRELRHIIELDNASILLIASMYQVKPLSPEFDEIVLRLANDPDWKNIRVCDGPVGTKMAK